MIFKISKDNFLINFILSSIYLLIPFLEFIKQNFKDYNIQILTTIISIFILILVGGIFFSLFIKFITKIKFTDIFFFYVVLIFLFFRWSDINILLENFTIFKASYISLLIIITISAIFSYFLIFKQEGDVKKLLVIFFSIYLLSLIINIFYKSININDQINFSQKNYNKEKVNTSLIKNDTNSVNRRNIYYIILDGMISLERFQEIYGIEKETLISSFNLDKFNYSKMNSSFFDTGQTIGSIFNLDYLSTDLIKDKKNLFANILEEENLQINKPKLIKILENNGYKFSWYSNSIKDCMTTNKKMCGETNESFIKSYINSYVAINFLSGSPLISIMKKINYKLVFKTYFDRNDTLNIFLLNSNFLDKDKPNFIFIHSMMPHSPFFYDEKCNFINNNDEKKWTTGYKMNYLCSLKRVAEFQNYILSKDKKAVVVIQGDHGYFFKNKKVLEKSNDILPYVKWMYENDQEELLKNYSTFNLIKNEDCILPENVKLDNVNSIIFSLNCALDINLGYKKKKTLFWFENKVREINNQ
jgi:hypothetical protein